MRGTFQIGLLLALSMACASIGAAQQASPTVWSEVPKQQGALVIFINENLNGARITVKGDKGEVLDSTVWKSNLPFLRQYRLMPGEHEVHLQGPVRSVKLNTPPATLTFLNLERTRPGAKAVGVTISAWTGRPTTQIVEVLTALEAAGEAKPVTILSATLGLYFSTDPPWPIPPPPPPKPNNPLKPKE